MNAINPNYARIVRHVRARLERCIERRRAVMHEDRQDPSTRRSWPDPAAIKNLAKLEAYSHINNALNRALSRELQGGTADTEDVPVYVYLVQTEADYEPPRLWAVCGTRKDADTAVETLWGRVDSDMELATAHTITIDQAWVNGRLGEQPVPVRTVPIQRGHVDLYTLETLYPDNRGAVAIAAGDHEDAE